MQTVLWLRTKFFAGIVCKSRMYESRNKSSRFIREKFFVQRVKKKCKIRNYDVNMSFYAPYYYTVYA